MLYYKIPDRHVHSVIIPGSYLDINVQQKINKKGETE